ncbi:MAG: DeoR/GlpR family DNA-binding transcription regulator [Propionibacteriaceae bacterium]|nr:DeoR/GlpR family DNA-binding transcription regulator [Propionibacteriaceae bacterium]
MIGNERKQWIRARIRSEASVNTTDVARHFRVSVETIRRDLVELERAGELVRIYGGATAPQRKHSSEPPFASRAGQFSQQRARIGKAAAALCQDGQLVFVDAGATPLEVAKALAETFDGTILTVSLLVASELMDVGKPDVVLAPGRLRRGEWSVTGAETVKFLERLHFDLAFIGCGGVDGRDGVTAYTMEDVANKEAAVHNSARCWVLADASKHAVVARARVADWGDIHGLVTDKEPPAGLARALHLAGTELIVAE